MGVFPLAGTISHFIHSAQPRGGNHRAPRPEWMNEVWWQPHLTTTPPRDAAQAPFPFGYNQSFHANLRRRASSRRRPRGADRTPAVLVFATGATRLQ